MARKASAVCREGRLNFHAPSQVRAVNGLDGGRKRARANGMGTRFDPEGAAPGSGVHDAYGQTTVSCEAFGVALANPVGGTPLSLTARHPGLSSVQPFRPHTT